MCDTNLGSSWAHNNGATAGRRAVRLAEEKGLTSVAEVEEESKSRDRCERFLAGLRLAENSRMDSIRRYLLTPGARSALRVVSCTGTSVGGCWLVHRAQRSSAHCGLTPSIAQAFCVTGIVGSLLAYGVLQERIMTQPYGEEKELFKYSVFLVLNNRLVRSENVSPSGHHYP